MEVVVSCEHLHKINSVNIPGTNRDRFHKVLGLSEKLLAIEGIWGMEQSDSFRDVATRVLALLQ